MSKYQLTERQKNILRAVSKGLRNGTIKLRWSWFTIPSDTCGHRLDLEITNGFCNGKELGISLQDLSDFERLGFLDVTRDGKGRGACDVKEKAIHRYCQNNLMNAKLV